jgi:MFS family permease
MPESRRKDPEVAKQLDISLDACIKEGVCAQIMILIFDYYLVPFALFIKATTFEIGLLVSLPHLLSALSQLFATRIVRSIGSRRKLLTTGVALQAAFLLPIPFLIFYPEFNSVKLLILLMIIFRVLGSILGPAWGSMVSDYLPEDRRGEFFGFRMQIIGISGVLSLAVWGIVLGLMNKYSEAWALFVVFFSAGLCRCVSYFYMKRMIEFPQKIEASDYFTFWMFIRRFKQSNFVKFIFYVACVTFATQLAAAYFSVYMLKELHFGYLTYTLISMASVITGLISFPVWGRHADQFGNAKILKVTGVLISIVPIFWMFTKNPFVLIMIEMFSGFAWGGFNLCSSNFIFDAVRPSKRVRCLSYYNLINSAAIFAGASLGGYLAYRLPRFDSASPLVTLFLLSAVFRLMAYVFLSGTFKEVRPAYKKIRSTQLFISVLGVRPLVGNNVQWGIFPTIKRFTGRKAPV